MVNRRIAVSALVGAAIGLVSGRKNQWVTVAHLGTNRNDRAYPLDALMRMAIAAVGKPVAKISEFDPPPLSDLLGVVSKTRYRESRVQIQVRWFSLAQIPVGQLISPWGVAQQTGGQIEWGTFELLSMRVSDSSAFQNNTRIG